MFRRLQTRIVLLFAILFVIVQLLTSFAVYRATTTNINAQINEQLIYSGEIVQQSIENDILQLAEGTKLLATDFGFRTAVATHDYPTILSALNNLVGRINADSALLIGLDENIIADTQKDTIDDMVIFSFPDLIETADYEGQAAAFIAENNKLYEMVVIPVLAPVPVAWIAIRIEVNNSKAQKVKEILPIGIDISYAIRDKNSSNQWLLVASTLSGEHKDKITNQIDINTQENLTAPLSLDDKDYLTLPVSFPSQFQNMDVRAVLKYSLDIAYSPYRSLIFALAALIALGLILLMGGSVFISRSVTQPISSLASFAKQIRAGNYTPIRLAGPKDEVHQLGTSFNLMIDGIRQREAKIVHQAEHDISTGLPNRVYLAKHLGSMIQDGDATPNCFCLLEVSVERFNSIRNTLGFTASEALIKLIGPRLISLTKEGDITARISASHFVVALPGVSVEEAYEISKRIMKGFEKPFRLDACTIDVMVKIGIVSYPNHGANAEELIQHASVASFQSKTNPQRIATYDAQKDLHDAEKLSLMSDLRRALDENTGEVQFHYQPKIDLKLGEITNAEALIRWIHPVRGFINPEEFIALAEQTGHIHLITIWALEQGIAQISQWQKMGHDLKVAINLSARDLTNKELPGIIGAVLKTHKVEANSLVLEVTESAVMEDPDLALEVLHELNEMGLTLSIDDYGTGYSSMAYIKQLPVKEIKIDKSFILNLASNKDDEIIVKSTIELGHNLGLKVTAEGIEDESSLNILKTHKCDQAQGYYFSRPLPIEEFNSLLSNSKLDI